MPVRNGLLILLLCARALRAEAVSPASSELPLQHREGLLWVQVNTPDGGHPLNFLLDTGASVSVLNLATAQRLGFNLGHQVNVDGVGTTAIGVLPG